MHLPIDTCTPRVYAWRVCMYGKVHSYHCSHLGCNPRFGFDRRNKESAKQWARYKQVMQLFHRLKMLADMPPIGAVQLGGSRRKSCTLATPCPYMYRAGSTHLLRAWLDRKAWPPPRRQRCYPCNPAPCSSGNAVRETGARPYDPASRREYQISRPRFLTYSNTLSLLYI